jgi:hypothetical protein
MSRDRDILVARHDRDGRTKYLAFIGIRGQEAPCKPECAQPARFAVSRFQAGARPQMKRNQARKLVHRREAPAPLSFLSGPDFLCEQHLRESLLIPHGPIAFAGKCDFEVRGCDTNAYRNQMASAETLRRLLAAEPDSSIDAIRNEVQAQLENAQRHGTSREVVQIRAALDALEDVANLVL